MENSNIQKKVKALNSLRFRNSILCDAVRNCENYDESLNETIEDSEYLIKYNHSNDRMGDTAYELFLKIANRASYIKNIIEVANYLKKIGSYFLDEPNNDDYYRVRLKERLKKCKSVLIKLRPFVIEQTKEWTTERKQKELQNPDLKEYFEGWY